MLPIEHKIQHFLQNISEQSADDSWQLDSKSNISEHEDILNILHAQGFEITFREDTKNNDLTIYIKKANAQQSPSLTLISLLGLHYELQLRTLAMKKAQDAMQFHPSQQAPASQQVPEPQPPKEEVPATAPTPSPESQQRNKAFSDITTKVPTNYDVELMEFDEDDFDEILTS